jgi:hypothetical protein
MRPFRRTRAGASRILSASVIFKKCGARRRKRPMTIEAAVFAAGSILVAALIWRTYRLTSRRLEEIQNDINVAGHLLTRAVAMGSNRRPEVTAASAAESATAQSDPAATGQTSMFEISPQLTQVDELCAKLITLAPPREALPLLSESKSGFGAFGPRPWPRRRGQVPMPMPIGECCQRETPSRFQCPRPAEREARPSVSDMGRSLAE